MPALAEASPNVQKQERDTMIKEGITGTKQELDNIYRTRFKAAVRWSPSVRQTHPKYVHSLSDVQKTQSSSQATPCIAARDHVNIYFIPNSIFRHPVYFVCAPRPAPLFDDFGH